MSNQVLFTSPQVTNPTPDTWYRTWRTVLLDSNSESGGVRILSFQRTANGEHAIPEAKVTSCTMGKNESFTIAVDDARIIVQEYDRWMSELK